MYGFFAVPDSPTNTKVRWLKKEDKEMAIRRMEQCGRKPPSKLTWRTMREVFTMWPVYVFSIAFAAQVLGIRVYNYFTVYLKAEGYSVEATNLIPTGAFGLQAVLTLMYAWLSDGIGKRLPSIYIGVTLAMIGTIILSIYPEQNKAAMMVGWYLTYAETGCAALIMAYLNETLSFSAEHRLVAIGTVETFAFVMNAWVILFAYDSGEAPHFSVGYEMATMFFALEGVFMAVAWYCSKRWKPELPTQP